MRKVIFISALLFVALSGHTQNTNKEISEAEIKKLSNDWMKATMARDEKTLNKLVAMEFKLGGTDLDKPVISRDMWMKNTMENLKIDSVNYIKMKIDIIENVAVVQSTFFWSVAFRDMEAKKDTVNLVDTWIKRGQGWQVVSRIVVD